MQLSNFPTTEILLSLLSFGLGIAATFFGQMVSRKLKFTDARKKLRYENLKKFRNWMEAYRDILKCQYPDMYAFWCSQGIAPPLWMPVIEPKFENDQANAILDALKKYREMRLVVDKAREVGQEALKSLVEPPSLFNLKARYLYRIYRRTFSTTGFTAEVSDHLKEFHLLFDFFYYSIEKDYAETQIDWVKLDTVSSDNLHKIVSFSRLRYERQNIEGFGEEYNKKHNRLTNTLNSVDSKKREARNHLDSIFDVIRKYESKWIVPDS